MPHVTMAQLAARAGVCKATVSLALRNDPRISPATIKRVTKVADELGYTRNPVLDELMSQLRQSRKFGYQRTIALLNAHPKRRAFVDNPTIPSWVAGCRRRAEYLGYTADEFWLHDPAIDGAQLRRILTARGIRGAIIIGAFNLDSIPDRFTSLWSEFPCIVTGVRTHDPALSFTCVDHHNLVLDAMIEVRNLGYLRPGLVLGREVDRVTDGRFTCAMWLAQQALPPAQRVPAFTFSSAAPDSEVRFGRWFQAHQPDVVLTLHPEVRTWLAILKLAVPRDIGLVHLERNRHTLDWAGMDQHNDIAGEAAVDLLTSMLQGRETGVPAFPRATLIGATWVRGETVRVKKPARAPTRTRRT
jgi:LacI family transcriptional regulator